MMPGMNKIKRCEKHKVSDKQLWMTDSVKVSIGARQVANEINNQ